MLRQTFEEIDYSDIPPLTEEFFKNATLRVPAIQAHNLVQLDPDIVTWFQSQGAEYKTLINTVLRGGNGLNLRKYRIIRGSSNWKHFAW